MNEMNLASRLTRRLRPFLRRRSRSFPAAEYFFNLIEDHCGRKITDQNQQRVCGRIILVIKLFELLATESGHLRFLRSDDCIGMLAEENAAQAFRGEEIGSGALNFQAFHSLAALAFKFFIGKRSITRQVSQHFEQTVGKIRDAGNSNRTGVSAGRRCQIPAHAAEIFFNAPERTGRRAGSRDGSGKFGQARRAVSHGCVPTAEEKLRGNFRKGSGFREDDLQSIGESENSALGPCYRALGAESGRRRAVRRSDRSRGHRDSPWFAGTRAKTARFVGTRYFFAAACTSAGVTAMKPSSTVLTRPGSPSNRVKHAR